MLPVDKFKNKKIVKVIGTSKTYEILLKKEEINGFCDNVKALEQSIYKILNTERYKHNIYSWNYGIEIYDLLGKDVNFVCLELPKRIRSALSIDNRIKDVRNFSFDINKRNIVNVDFDVITVFGEVSINKEVKI